MEKQYFGKSKKMKILRDIINMKKKFFTIFYLFFSFVAFAEIPNNIKISDNSEIKYKVINDEKVEMSINIDGVSYSDEFFYTYYENNEKIDIPIPKFLMSFDDSIVLIKGQGTSYREIFIYNSSKEKIVKTSYENNISVNFYPKNYELYAFSKKNYLVLVKNYSDYTKIKQTKIKLKSKTIKNFEIFEDEIIVNYDSKLKTKISLKTLLDF